VAGATRQGQEGGVSLVLAAFADNIDVEACSLAGVSVTVCEDRLSEPTADLAFGLLPWLARRINEGDVLVRQGEYRG
jgi:phosphonate dehydrogenase